MLATVAEAQKDRAQRESWRSTEELLALVVEVLDLGNRMFHAANMKGQVPKPIEIHRPGATNRSSDGAEADKPKLTRAAMRAVLLGG